MQLGELSFMDRRGGFGDGGYRGVARCVIEVVTQEMVRLTPLIRAHTQPTTLMPTPSRSH